MPSDMSPSTAGARATPRRSGDCPIRPAACTRRTAP
jgi:hypothetical protein